MPRQNRLLDQNSCIHCLKLYRALGYLTWWKYRLRKLCSSARNFKNRPSSPGVASTGMRRLGDKHNGSDSTGGKTKLLLSKNKSRNPTGQGRNPSASFSGMRKAGVDCSGARRWLLPLPTEKRKMHSKLASSSQNAAITRCGSSAPRPNTRVRSSSRSLFQMESLRKNSAQLWRLVFARTEAMQCTAQI